MHSAYMFDTSSVIPGWREPGIESLPLGGALAVLQHCYVHKYTNTHEFIVFIAKGFWKVFIFDGWCIKTWEIKWNCMYNLYMRADIIHIKKKYATYVCALPVWEEVAPPGRKMPQLTVKCALLLVNSNVSAKPYAVTRACFDHTAQLVGSSGVGWPASASYAVCVLTSP